MKSLLVFDKSADSRQDLRVAHPDAQVQCLSNTTTSLPQLLDQGIITTFKTKHAHHTFHCLLHASEKEGVGS